jgi:uncharacterized membrane protein (DUF2068 family)
MRKPLKIGHKSIALLKVIRGTGALIVSLALWRIAIAGELQDVKDKLQTLSQRLDEPLINVIVSYLLQANDQHLFLLAMLITMLSAIRFAEAIGLWSLKKWAEILALISSLLYIPFELISLFKGFSLTVMTILILNIFVTGYLFRTLRTRSISG